MKHPARALHLVFRAHGAIEELPSVVIPSGRFTLTPVFENLKTPLLVRQSAALFHPPRSVDTFVDLRGMGWLSLFTPLGQALPMF